MIFAGIALLAVCFTGTSQREQLPIVEQRAITRIEQAGGTFAWVKEEGRTIFCLDVNAKDKTFDFGTLAELRSLQVLRVFQGRIDPKSVIHLTTLKKLELLVITSDGLTDSAMKSIGKLKALTKLDVKGDGLTNVGLAELVHLKALRRLFLYNTMLQDSHLAPLYQLKWLDELCVPMTVSDAGLARLKAALPQSSVRKF